MKDNKRRWQNLLICLLMMVAGTASGQQKGIDLSFKNNELPIDSLQEAEYPELDYRGDCVEAIRWTDRSGEHYLLLNETGEEPTDEQGYRNAFLWGYHFLNTDSGTKRVWTFMDFVQDCPIDIEARFLRNALRITDLDNDGIAEVWLLYQLACKGDVSPSEFHIVLYHTEQSYVKMSGETKLVFPNGVEEGGGYTFDKGFAKLPRAFREYGQWLWERYVG